MVNSVFYFTVFHKGSIPNGQPFLMFYISFCKSGNTLKVRFNIPCIYAIAVP